MIKSQSLINSSEHFGVSIFMLLFIKINVGLEFEIRILHDKKKKDKQRKRKEQRKFPKSKKILKFEE